MEYSIGFFGGLGMAYGTLTATWADSSSPVRRRTNLVPILVVVLFIPYVIWNQSFITDKLGFLLTLGGSEVTIFTFQWMSILSILMTAVIVLVMYYRPGYDYRAVRFIFVLYLGLYTFLSFLLTGIITHPIEQYLYLVNMAIILVLLPRVQNGFEPKADSPRKWVAIFVLVMLILAVLAAIAIASHGPLKGSQIRFE
jgi:magnesium-transporting ATPase (P-type)